MDHAATERRQPRRRTYRLQDGSRVSLRPICPGDRELLLEAFSQLSEESRYRRFFTPMKELSSSVLSYLSEVDHHDHEALIALSESGAMVGVARFVRDADEPAVAEAAITVVDGWQGRGLGKLLLRRLASRAREEGISQFRALVKVENPPAVELLKGLGRTQVVREGSEYELLIDLPARGAGARLAHALRASAMGSLSFAETAARVMTSRLPQVPGVGTRPEA